MEIREGLLGEEHSRQRKQQAGLGMCGEPPESQCAGDMVTEGKQSILTSWTRALFFVGLSCALGNG